MEEVITDAIIDRSSDRNEEEEDKLLVEMHQNSQEGHVCKLAETLVDTAKNTSVTVCMSNSNNNTALFI